MLEISAIIHGKRYVTCDFCKHEVNEQEAIDDKWLFCPCCGRELWGARKPWM